VIHSIHNTGLFITFEGIDACGKSTQIEMLYRYLNDKNRKVAQVRDPGSTSLSEAIRTMLLDRENTHMSAWTELLLYEAARAQLVEERIKPYLNRKYIVLCDRFYDSTTAYQGYARQLDKRLIEEANAIGSCGLTPHLTFYLDVDPQVSLARKAKLGQLDRMEAEGSAFQARVREGFQLIQKNHPDRVKWIDGDQPVDSIHKKITAIVDQFLKNLL